MTPRLHAQLAKRLIAACGGLDESAKASGHSRSRLGDYQNPNEPDAIMRADLIFKLEEYCGQPHYSRALFEARPHVADFVCLITEAYEDTEEAAEMQRLARKVTADGQITGAEKVQLLKALAGREQQFRELKAAVEKVAS